MVFARPYYPCQRCNKDMFGTEQDSSRRKYCKKCFYECVAEKKETFSCDICGVVVTRRKTNRQFRFKCCSKICQQKARHLAKRTINKDAIAARIKRQDEKADEIKTRRKEDDEARPYWRAWVTLTQKVNGRESYRKDVWLTKILNRITQARPECRRRDSLIVKSQGWYWSLKKADDKIEYRVRYYQLCPWQKKIQNKLSNSSKRIRVKREVKKRRSERNQKKVGGKWIQMRFDWMELRT